MMKKVGIVTIALFFLGGILWAADFWEKADYTSWSQKDCEQMLTKSPWAFQYVHTNFYRPTTNIPAAGGTATDGEGGAGFGQQQSGERESRILFQFTLVTAKPIRMARARMGLIQSATMKDQAEQFVNQPVGKEILIQVQYASRPPSLSSIRHPELLSPRHNQHFSIKYVSDEFGLEGTHPHFTI